MRVSPHSPDFLASEARLLVEMESVRPKTACERVCRRYDVWPFRQKVEETLNALLKLQGKTEFGNILAEADRQVKRVGRSHLPYRD